MSSIIVDREEFAYLVISFLLDSLLHEDDMIIDNEDWNFIMKKIKLGGLKAHLMNTYIKMDSERRVDYKRIKKVFYEESGSMNVVKIKGKSNLKEDTAYKYKIKDLLREAVRLIDKEKNRSGYTVSGEKVDKIIEHVINKQDNWTKGE